MPRWAQYAAVAAVMALAIAADLASPFADASNAVNYSYDAWGRVTGATYQGSGNLTTGYTYDPAGNRTQVATSAAPMANAVAIVVGANTSANNVPLSVAGPYTSVTVQSAASHGTATASGTTITFTPTTGYTGADSFTYTATNGSGTSAAATVGVTVAPVANAVSTPIAYNSTNNAIPYTVTGTYTSVALASRPSNGTAAASGTSLTYTPNTGYIGPDSFQYTAAISLATSAPATISLTVNPPPPVANPVSAQVVTNTTNNNIPLSITGGTPTSVAVGVHPTHGTATASGITIKYTPTSGYSGSDSFTYTASNAGGTSAPATASITVLAIIADGTVMYSNSTPNTYSFTLPINAPPYVTVFLYGAGGGGWGSASNHHGGGGGGFTTYHFAITPGVTVLSGNIGLQGDGGFHIISDPTDGSPTTLASPVLTANGGIAGTSTAGGAGGTASGGSTNTTGQAGDVAGVQRRRVWRREPWNRRRRSRPSRECRQPTGRRR